MKTKKIIFILPEDYTFSIPSLFSFKKKYNYKISGLIFSKGFFDMKKLISIFFLFNFKDHIKFLIKNFIKKEQEQINKQFTTFIASSAGGLISLILILNYSYQEIEHITYKHKFNNYENFDYNFFGSNRCITKKVCATCSNTSLVY